MSNKLAEKKKSFSFIPSILKEFERNSRLCNDVVSSWSKNLNRSTEDGKVKLNIRSETDIQRQAMRKVTHQKSLSTGRKYTSKVYYLKFVKFLLFPSFQYRGVHQTFPTRRWEAQFRKGGKPTSLGCFDKEDQAARAYDRMMLWNEIHTHSLDYIRSASIQKPSCTSLNFDISEYEDDLETLRHISQEELLYELRKQGRLQASSGTVQLQ